MGYRLIDDDSVWLGYRWTGHNPYNNFYQENRLFEQLIHQKKFAYNDRFIARTRLEEIQRSNSNQISLRLRQRMAVELRRYSSKFFPFLYDEVFFQLNNTSYTSNNFVSENRLFIGGNFITSRNTWWEIGYINQFQMHTPQASQNIMSHIISVTYNLA